MEQFKNSLIGKTVFFLGSSITAGSKDTDGQSFVEMIAEQTGCDYQKEALSGTTLADNDVDAWYQETSYCTRIDNFEWWKTPYAIVVQISTNDFTKGFPVGLISSHLSPEEQDRNTVAGALEYVLATIKKNAPKCKVIVYSSPMAPTYSAYEAYKGFVEWELVALQKKWGFQIADLFHQPNDNYLKHLAEDGIHPTTNGYRYLFVKPIIEELLRN
ncbi:MAG: SGNH/GDSL hydrolase family protein [Bacilli bacterium]|nr:SGNH/GDSL hydrolase family protein [Bacilli bacterium]